MGTIQSHDRAAVHEAMEQQTVSVAKGGLMCRLRSQCSVIAAQNCKKSRCGRGNAYDTGASLAVNSGLPPPILSRFDLVVVFAESGRGATTEEDKADFILKPKVSRKVATPQNASQGSTAFTGEDSAEDGPYNATNWGHEKLRDYIAWVKDSPLDPQKDDPNAAEVSGGRNCTGRDRSGDRPGARSWGVTTTPLGKRSHSKKKK